MPTTGTPGSQVTLTAEFFNEMSGSLIDATSVQLDITYGTAVGLIADTAGPFTYHGASLPSSSQVYRTATGTYGFVWQVPGDAASGVYVANWSFGYSGDTFLTIENFTITGGSVPVGPPNGDTGYWTGGILYNGLDVEFGVVDGDGITWLWQKLEGWDGPDVTGGLLQKAGDHGAWPSPQFYQPRTLTWTVMASAPTQALRDLARSKLSQAIPVSDLAVLRYDEPVPKQAQVRRAGKIAETYPTLTDVSFSVPLVAPDPRKYSTQQQILTTIGGPSSGITFPLTFPFAFPPHVGGAEIACTNNGDFETRPVISIRGPVVGPSLVNTATGQAVKWASLTLTSADVLTVDFGVQQGYLNGAYRPADPSSWWWNLAPGTTVVALDAVSNTGAVMTVSFADSWI